MHYIEKALIIVGSSIVGGCILSKASEQGKRQGIEYKISSGGAIAGFTISSLLIYINPIRETIRAHEFKKMFAVSTVGALAMTAAALGSDSLLTTNNLSDKVDEFCQAIYNTLPKAHETLAVGFAASVTLASVNLVASIAK
jgi:hypothetical protein